jgi:hypothetical protein
MCGRHILCAQLIDKIAGTAATIPPSVIARGTVDDRFEHVERGQSLA